MKTSILLIILSFISMAHAQSVSKKQLRDMGYNKLQKVRFAYVEFMMRVELDEKRGKIPDIKKKTTSFQRFWNELLISNAYAIAPDGSLCFFGGWPSKMTHGKCSRPWTQKSDEDVKRLGVYDAGQSCGGATKFHCNPTLFGSPDEDGKGICVDTGGSFNHLTEKCERASRALVPKIIEAYQVDPTAITALGGEIKNFCDSYEEYDGCDDLARRLKEITGEEVGAYPANGSLKPGDPEPQKAGERSRNVNVVGEHLRPGADLNVRTANTGAQVLNRCQDLLKDKADVQNRNILGVMNTEECSDEVEANLNSLDDFKKAVQKIDKKTIVSKINAKAFEQNILAMVANEIRFGPKTLNFTDKETLFNSLVSENPDLKNNPIYKEAFERVFKNLNEEAKAGRLYPFEPESTTVQFNNLSIIVNGACKKIRENYTKKFGEPGIFARFMDSDAHDAFFTAEVAGIHREMDVLLSESVVGHLLSTNHFKQNVFDPSEEFAEECARNPSYQVIKRPISSETINQGHAEVMSMMKENLKKLNERENDLKDGEDADDILADFLKMDSGIVSMAMDDLDATEQYSLGALICNKTNQILTSDKNWRYADLAIGGIGLTAGVVLTATGIGSPIGMALTAASLGMAGYQGARAVNNYQDAKQVQKAADLALAQRRERMQNYLVLESNISAQKKEALYQGGFAALSGFPPVRALTAARGGKTLALPRPTSKVPRTPRINLAKRIPSRATATSKFDVKSVLAYLKRGPSKLKSLRPKITFKKFAMYSIGIMLGKKVWDDLTADEQIDVTKNVTEGFAQNGFMLPSYVAKDLDPSALSLKEAYNVVQQMVGKSATDEQLAQFESMLQPEAYGEQPPAVKEFILKEQGIFNALKERIIALEEQEEEQGQE